MTDDETPPPPHPIFGPHLVDDDGQPVYCSCGRAAVRKIPVGPGGALQPTCISVEEGIRAIAEFFPPGYVDRLMDSGDLDGR